jgi:hypothetical protein
MLGFLEKLTLAPDDVGPEDVAPLRAAGVSEDAIADAIHVCALFNVIDRIADALAFALPEQDYWRRVAPGFLAGGYAEPASRLDAGGPRPARPGPRHGR